MGLNFGSDEIESLALGDTPLEALMLGEVELWAAKVALETTTVLTVVPDEIEEGESTLLTATVTPSEAVGEVVFTVGTQTYTVALEDGTAESEAVLEEAGDFEITADFIPANEADFLPSSATGSITVAEAVVELYIESTGSSSVPRNSFQTLGSLTVPADMTADIRVGYVWDLRGAAYTTTARQMELVEAGSRLRFWSQRLTSSSSDNIGWNEAWRISGRTLKAGDIVSLMASGGNMNAPSGRTVLSWYLEIVPV